MWRTDGQRARPSVKPAHSRETRSHYRRPEHQQRRRALLWCARSLGHARECSHRRSPGVTHRARRMLSGEDWPTSRRSSLIKTDCAGSAKTITGLILHFDSIGDCIKARQLTTAISIAVADRGGFIKVETHPIALSQIRHLPVSIPCRLYRVHR